jgi:LacI family transcriptional regulator, galactose operon repressor
MATMREVAAIAGVSAKTVSRVFNDDPHVTPETRARVEATLRQLNYVPNAVATTFRTGRSPVVGIAVPDLVDPFFAAIAKSVNRLATHRGMSTVVTSLGDETQKETDVVGRLLSQSLSGLIIAPVATDHSYLNAWKERLPIVFVDRAPIKLAVDSITEDDSGGAHAATQHLIDHGHRRIAFIGDTADLPTSYGRLLGYRAALAEHDIRHDTDYEAFGAVDRESAEGVVRKLTELPDAPTAIMSSNARSTMALVPALRERAFALVGFGDFPMADMLDPPITVIDQDPAALGKLAAQRVFDRLDHPARRFRRRTVLPVTLIERSSCLVRG